MRWQSVPASNEVVRRFCYFRKPAEGVALPLGSEVLALFVCISHAGYLRCTQSNMPALHQATALPCSPAGSASSPTLAHHLHRVPQGCA